MFSLYFRPVFIIHISRFFVVCCFCWRDPMRDPTSSRTQLCIFQRRQCVDIYASVSRRKEACRRRRTERSRARSEARQVQEVAPSALHSRDARSQRRSETRVSSRHSASRNIVVFSRVKFTRGAFDDDDDDDRRPTTRADISSRTSKRRDLGATPSASSC